MNALIDLTGRVYGRLTVIERAEDRVYPSGRKAFWLCRCKCGTKVEVQGSNLGINTWSCGCLHREVLSGQADDLAGRVFDRLTVLKRVEDYVSPSGERKPRWLCRCKCKAKTKVVVWAIHLKSGATRSCGCVRRETTKARASKEVIGYMARHQRLRQKKPASACSCVDCGRPAQEWSYVENCAAELIDGGHRYCMHDRHYAPRCKPCHVAFDHAHKMVRVERLLKKQLPPRTRPEVRTLVASLILKELYDDLAPRKPGEHCRIHHDLCAFSDDDPKRCSWCHTSWQVIESSGYHSCTIDRYFRQLALRP